MELKALKSKVKRLKKLQKELESVDVSGLIGKKVKITKDYVRWCEDNADEIGIPYVELKLMLSKPTGVITEAKYEEDDQFTFCVDFDNINIRLGVEDIREVK